MSEDTLIIYEAEIKKIETLLNKMLKGAEAKCALLVDKDGHLINRADYDTAPFGGATLDLRF